MTEPTELNVAIAHKGFAGFEIENAGRAAHGSRPERGIDAIARIGPVLVELSALADRLRSEGGHPLLGNRCCPRWLGKPLDQLNRAKTPTRLNAASVG